MVPRQGVGRGTDEKRRLLGPTHKQCLTGHNKAVTTLDAATPAQIRRTVRALVDIEAAMTVRATERCRLRPVILKHFLRRGKVPGNGYRLGGYIPEPGLPERLLELAVVAQPKGPGWPGSTTGKTP